MSRGDEGDSEERRKVKPQTHKGDRGTNRQTCTTAYACIASRGKSNQKTKYRPIAVKTSGEKRAGCDVYNLTRPSHCCLSVPSVTVRCLDSVLSRSRTRCDMEREASGWTLDRTSRYSLITLSFVLLFQFGRVSSVALCSSPALGCRDALVPSFDL